MNEFSTTRNFLKHTLRIWAWLKIAWKVLEITPDGDLALQSFEEPIEPCNNGCLVYFW